MALIEGNSIASTCRMTGAAKMTVLSLIREVGESCLRFHDAVVRDLATERVQADEVWSFCYAKRSRPDEGSGCRLDLDVDRARRGFEADGLVDRE